MALAPQPTTVLQKSVDLIALGETWTPTRIAIARALFKQPRILIVSPICCQFTQEYKQKPIRGIVRLTAGDGVARDAQRFLSAFGINPLTSEWEDIFVQLVVIKKR